MNTPAPHKERAHGTVWSYSIGFVLSIALTLGAFGLYQLHVYTNHVFPTHATLYVGLVLLAVLQLLIQLAFFLHIDKGESGRWNSAVLVFTLIIVTVVVGGTLWIMSNLQHNLPTDMSQPFMDGHVSPQTEND